VWERYKELLLLKLVVFFILCSLGTVAAQEKANVASPHAFSLGLGAEANSNTRENYALGGMAQIDFRVFRLLSVGIKGVYSISDTEVRVIEADAFLRWNALTRAWKNRGETVLFLQAEGGAAFGREQDPAVTNKHGDGEMVIDPSGGITAGIRITTPINLYIEPYGRFGYPYLWAGGVAIGYTFRKKQPSAPKTVIQSTPEPTPKPAIQPEPAVPPPPTPQSYPPQMPPIVRVYPPTVVYVYVYPPPVIYLYPLPVPQLYPPPARYVYPAPVARPVPPQFVSPPAVYPPPVMYPYP
jgi:hypothetical protein